MASALVTDARLIMSLPIIRSLGRAGISVRALETREHLKRPALGFYSRYTAKRILCDELPERLSEEAAKVDAVFPVSGNSVYCAARLAADETFRSKVALPELSAIQLANDKAQLNELAKALGIPVPETFHPERQVDLDAPSQVVQRELQAWARGLTYPAIVKYRYGEELHLPTHKRYRVVRDADEFAKSYLEIHSAQPFPVVQEYLPGEDYGAAVLCDKSSRVVAAFTYKSLRQRPKEGGPTSYAVSQAIPQLVSSLSKICSALNWYGVAMADFRMGQNAQFKLLEINPRFWGSLALAVEAGVDFPLLYYHLVKRHGELDIPAPEQRDGVTIKFFIQDLFAVTQYAKTMPSPLKYALRETLRILSPRIKDAVFKLNDPGPGLAYLLGLFF
ncbi:MAG TPA: ATP-grasp domain-containing protein [Firmicutes bacterium]|nr:ATP-grasp domain-containing protein [Bacillota bacterium]